MIQDLKFEKEKEKKILLPYDGSIYTAYHTLQHLKKRCVPSVFGFSDKGESMAKMVEEKGLALVQNVRDYSERLLWKREKTQGDNNRYNIDWRFRFSIFEKGSLGYAYTRGLQRDGKENERRAIKDSDQKEKLISSFAAAALELGCNTLFWPTYEWGPVPKDGPIQEHKLEVVECIERPSMKDMVEEFYITELENEEMRGEIKFLQDGFSVWDMIFACECNTKNEHDTYVKDV